MLVRLTMSLVTHTLSGTTLKHKLKTSNMLKMHCPEDVAEDLIYFRGSAVAVLETTLRHMLRPNNMIKMLLPQCRQCEEDVAKEFIHLNQVLGQNLNQLVWQWIDRSQGYFQRFRRSGFDLAVGTVYSRRLCKKSSISDRMAPMTSASAVNWSSYGRANIQWYKIYTWVCSVRPDLLVCLHEGIVWNCD